MKLTKDDFDFINTLILLNKKKITPLDFTNLKGSQIQYKFDKINYLLKITNKSIIKKRFNNFYIHNFSDLKNITSNFDFTFFNKTQRLNIIIKKLLIDNYISIGPLEELFSQSKSSIKKDLKELKEKLKENSLDLIYKNRLGLTIEGSENDIRFFFLSYFLKNFNFFFENINIRETEYLIFNMLKGKNSSFETSKILSIVLSVQYYRIKNKLILTKLKDPLFTISNNAEYKLKTYYKFVDNISNVFDNYYEKSSLLFFLFGLCYSGNNPIILKKEEIFYSNLISILKNIGNDYNLNLHSDNYLIKTLGSHLKSAIFKISNKIPIINPCLQEGIVDYADLINKIKKECKELENTFKIKFNDDEIIFIFFHIKSSMLRLEKNKTHKKNILLVCNLGVGASKVLKDQLSKHFLLNIIDEISFYQFQVYNLEKVDFIIHTVDFLNSHIPSIKVNPLLTIKDLQTLEKLGFIKI